MIERENLDFIDCLSVQETALLLLLGIQNLSIVESKYASDVVVFCSLYKQSDILVKEKVNESVFLAIESWDPQKQTPEILEELALIGAYTRNEKVINKLIQVVDEKQFPDGSEINSILIAVLCGFSKNGQSSEALNKWFFDETFPWKNKGQLLIGLVLVQPERTNELLMIFMEIVRKHTETFRLDLIMMQIAGVIGINELQKILKEIEWQECLTKEFLGKIALSN